MLRDCAGSHRHRTPRAVLVSFGLLCLAKNVKIQAGLLTESIDRDLGLVEGAAATGARGVLRSRQREAQSAGIAAIGPLAWLTGRRDRRRSGTQDDSSLC